MKRAILLTIFFLMGIYGTAFPQQNDNRLIRQLIDQETRYFAEANYDGWSSCWIQTPGVLFTYAGSEGYNKIQGWKEISTAIRNAMPEKPLGSKLVLRRDNFHFEVGENMAWVWFEQHDNLSGTPTDKMETRVLKKVDGEWKILNVSVVETSSYQEQEE